MGLRVMSSVPVTVTHAIRHAECQNQALTRPNEVTIVTEQGRFSQQFSHAVDQISQAFIFIRGTFQPAE